MYYGRDETHQMIQLRIQQMQQQAERDRLARMVTTDRRSPRRPLAETVSHALVLIGARLSAARRPARSLPSQPVATVCCDIAVNQCATC